jgi:hypothetical protein
MSFQELLGARRPSFPHLRFADVTCDNPSDSSNVRGMIAEAYVWRWLERCEVLWPRNLPQINGRERLMRSHYGGVLFTRDGQDIAEYDFLFSYAGQPFIAEVKSGGLNGAGSNVATALSFAERFYGMPANYLLFSLRNHEHLDPRVSVVLMGFSRESLEQKAQRFGRWYKQRHENSRTT